MPIHCQFPPASTRAHLLGELLVRVPLTPKLKLRVGANSLIVRSAPGIDDTGLEDALLGFKLALAPGSGAAPAVAVIAGATVLTGSAAFDAERVQPGGTLSLTWELTERAGLGWNGGYSYASEKDDR